MILSYKYRVYPNKAQLVALNAMLADLCSLYNAALEHRILAYAKGVNVHCFDQIKALTEIRRDLPHIGRWACYPEQQVMRRLDKAFRAFFGRVKRGDAPGFPRFQSRERFSTAEFRISHGLRIRDTGKVSVVGIGMLKVRWHRPLPGKPQSVLLTRKAGRWFIIFRVAVTPTERCNEETIGIDLGLSNLVALSNGHTENRPRWAKAMGRERQRRQRAFARCHRRSRQREHRKAQLIKFYASIAAKRRDYLHKVSSTITKEFGRIAIEDLNVDALGRGCLAKEVGDAAWAILISMISYKAAKAGGEVIKVNARGTSQTCPECGKIEAKPLRARVHNCSCGCMLDRDVAAAKVIHHRAFGFWPGTGHGSQSGLHRAKLGSEVA